MNKKILTSFNIFCVVFIFTFIPLVSSAAIQPPRPIFPGVVESEGTHFEITNSAYLNIVLDSSEPIKLRMESIPQMVTMLIKKSSLTPAAQTQIIIKGFFPLTTYYKFEDDYHNLTPFTTDENGSYTYIQDISSFHFIFIQPRVSTKFIKDDATGGDCRSIGTWDQPSKTCVLTTNLNETIQIDNNDIILDGNNHTITGTNTGTGIYLYQKLGVTIKNLNINAFGNGIFLFFSSTNSLEQNTILNSGFDGISLYYYSSNNAVKNNIIDNSGYDGIHLEQSSNNNIDGNTINSTILNFGIYLRESTNNIVKNNTSKFNKYAGIHVLYADNNVFTNNNILNNYLFGIDILPSNNNQFYNNNVINNPIQVYVYGGSSGNIFNLPLPTGGNYWSNFDASVEGCGDLNNDKICDAPYVFTGGQDNLPWTKQDGWKLQPPNQPPTISSLNQFKSDGQTKIIEGGITTESSFDDPKTGVAAFKAIINDSDNDQVKLQIELKEQNQLFNGQDLLESGFAISGSEIAVIRTALFERQYHWRARAKDANGNTSDWQEFGTPGNVDFEVKLVPLYTQVRSPYPSDEETRIWFDEFYGNGGIGGYAEYRITLVNIDNYTLTVNGKDDEAVDSQTGKKITTKVGACIYKTKDKYEDPICITEKMLSWPLGDNQYKSVSVALGRVIAGNYFLRLTSKEDYFDLNKPDESGNLNVYLDWFEIRNDAGALLRKEAENYNTLRGGAEALDNNRTVVKIDGYSCGLTIANCGCSMTSMVMLGKFYGINNGIDNTEVNPYFMNNWLRKNNGYNKLGNLAWGKDKEIGAITYLGFKDSENITNVRLSLDVYNTATTSPAIDQYLNSIKPAIVRNDRFGHYFIMDGKLASAYTIKDPVWYNTKTLNDNRIGEHIQNYGGKINAVNLFSYLSVPKKVVAYSKSTQIYIASPAEMLIIDPQGRRLGKDQMTSMEYNEIPDATYTYETPPVSEEPIESKGAPRIKVADIPDTVDGKYNIKVFGLRIGSYTLEFLTNDTSGKVKNEMINGLINADNVQDFEFNYSSQNVDETQLQQIVPIDIKPGSFPNSVNCRNNNEIIPVAISTTPLFDATAIDADTVRFGPAGAQETHRDKKTGKAQRHVEDIDKDGDLDLVFHFRFGDTDIQCGDEKAALTGLTIDVHNIIGTDTIGMVKVSVLSAGIIELPFQFFKSLVAKFARWLGFLYEYFFPPKPTLNMQSEKIARESCLKENEGVWVIPRYWSSSYSYRFNNEIVEPPLTVYVYSDGVIPKEGVSEDEADKRVIENNNFNFTISDVESSAIPPEIRKCGIYVSKLFKEPRTRYEAWKYDYSGKGERIMVLDAFDEHGASIKESSNASYSEFKIDKTEKYIALVRSWYGEHGKHALVIQNLKTSEDVYVITLKELMERYGISVGTIQLSVARERSVLFEVLNDENPWFRLNIDTRELERTDILP